MSFIFFISCGSLSLSHCCNSILSCIFYRVSLNILENSIDISSIFCFSSFNYFSFCFNFSSYSSRQLFNNSLLFTIINQYSYLFPPPSLLIRCVFNPLSISIISQFFHTDPTSCSLNFIHSVRYFMKRIFLLCKLAI